ncbi:hypothetical protein MYCTH_2296271 [Thermothelomyces thermophilus ATCC 42464]|uniref:REJ domain-containing protein n=1 Tax=Thermothelomyces thermophilus (strain ATCC 42464 / BCRC 31852 / DSM 1799) TaxID=573729 RepID=G2Q113_THET4|nr:uncharacterized protein MYCTH_2296271 [Thermothelomyces thermophilus ATCC 42464]AEO54111.1 hypothetical protein MYCTH_2296271 [Thermothelomyces thermophilus ATCC 42464]
MAPPDIQGARQAAQQRNSASSVAQAPARSEESSPQRRNDGQLDCPLHRRFPTRSLMPADSESWVEVTSQPSSSSLSSIGDDIVTTGLRVGNPSYPPRRRRSQQQHQMPASFIVGHPATQGGATSSQDEYDETESEEDRVLTSSTEAIHPSANLLRQQTTVRAPAVVDTDSDSDDDESATALGRPTNTTPVFRPQPNAFSHPPSHRTHRHSTGSAPHHHQHHSSQSRPQMPNRPHAHSYRGSPNYMSPSYQADNDAALRASLTTLLSCAAAARGLPKHDERRTAPATGAGVVPSSQPMELRLVPEAELMAADDSPAQPPPPPTTTTTTATATNPASKSQARTASNSSAPSAPSSSSSREQQQRESKRTAATQSRPACATKKKRISAALADGGGGGTAADGETTPFLNISPTLLTWVVSAGVVVLVSVVGFGAGYVIGREVGRQEGAAASLGGGFGGSAAASGANASSAAAAGCGGELVRAGSGSAGSGTLRRLRWGAVGKSVAA